MQIGGPLVWGGSPLCEEKALCVQRRPFMQGGGPLGGEEASVWRGGRIGREEALSGDWRVGPLCRRRPSVWIGGPLCGEEVLHARGGPLCVEEAL